jgi:acetyl-CoA carboxylase carboxyltransferase component
MVPWLKNFLEEAQSLQQENPKGAERQRRLHRLTARERIDLLFDPGTPRFELGLFQGWEMYKQYGNLPAAGVLTVIGTVRGKGVMVVANDATVKAGSFFPQTVKKVLRAQNIAWKLRLPLIYLVDSSGVFLPLQDEIFPDQDDFGRIFRNNSRLSALGHPQFSAIMGECIAGGAYLPVLSDILLMTEGSGLFIAGPSLVEAAIGQKVSAEALGGAKLHAEKSGTVDMVLPNDPACLERLRFLADLLPERYNFLSKEEPLEEKMLAFPHQSEYEMRDLITLVLDKGSFEEFRPDWGKSLVTIFGKIGGIPIGVVANQKSRTENGKGEVEMGGVIYPEGALKAARFVMECNQLKIPLVFIQDVSGFMVGKGAEEAGIIRAGAKLVNAVSNSVVPKWTILVGNSFGAGHYALAGKAYDPDLILAWPNARYAVMGGEQAALTLSKIDPKLGEGIRELYQKEIDIRYGAARGWVDEIIDPRATRNWLKNLLQLSLRRPFQELPFQMGVLQA